MDSGHGVVLLLFIFICLIISPILMFFCLVYWIPQGQIEQWIDFSTNEIDAHIAAWHYPRLGIRPHLPPVMLLMLICNNHIYCSSVAPIFWLPFD